MQSFTSNWAPTGGVDDFARLVGNLTHNDFFTNDAAKSLYKDYVRTILMRKNTINGRT